MKCLNACSVVLWLLLALLPVCLFPGPGAANTCEQWARIVSTQGVVEVKRAGQIRWMPVSLNDIYCPGDAIRSGPHSRAAVFLSNEATIRMDQNTIITLPKPKKDQSLWLKFIRGAAHFFSRTPRSLMVETPFFRGAVEGTEFFVQVGFDQALLSVFEGQIRVTNELGGLALKDGESAVAREGREPEWYTLVRPRDAVQWALYYPPIMESRPGDFGPNVETDWKKPAGKPIGVLRQGDLAGALDSLKAGPEDIRDPRLLAYRASQLLAVGRVDEARAHIRRALHLDPNCCDAFALQAIIAVVQNEKEVALETAQKAVAAGPGSATARIAMSYARQAGFDLKRARESIEAALKLDPHNALAWARLAELWSSFGRLGKALDAAKKAVDLNPNLSRTQMVLGFIYLTQLKTTASKAAFEKAIELDQADPLSRLGLGLSKIRDGDLKAGGREIEIAASLDPNNALIRSYLGKFYFEAKRTGLDEGEYAVAKELDPNDPTPYFYDAIAKQTTNRPVEALHDLQKARELNDNRAVYRSRLLLDSDDAARSAALARIYSDLGFQQRALVEGWQSVNTDPSDFAGHRFLADSYAVLPRHEIARVSELLQSQLLQPLNITPIQSRLAESNLFLISAGGTADLSYNEFNPIFNRDQVVVQGSGLWAENSTYGGEGAVSGIYQEVSGSGGYTHLETQGFRENNDQEDDIANVFAQYELTYQTSIQAEYRYRKTEKGDQLLRFDPDNFFPNRRDEIKADSIRLGFHHAFSPGSHLIGNFVHSTSEQDVDDQSEMSDLFELSPGFFVPATIQTISNVETENETYGGELQHQFRSKSIKIISGAGHVDTDLKIRPDAEVSIILEPPYPHTPIPIPADIDPIDTDVKHTNLYLYSHIHLPENVTVTIGASGDFFEGGVSEVEDKDQFNPKFGVVWNPVPKTTLRGAVFRTLTRTLVDAQTVEPTQVAGFNQFYYETRSTDAWRYGGAIDQKISEGTYAGAEYSMRDLEVPSSVGGAAFPNQRVERKEYLGRAYLFWTPSNCLGLSAEYHYERFDYDIDSYLGAKEVTTHGFPLGVNFFHPSGLSASLKATYYDQESVFKRVDTGEFVPGEDDFWVVDAAINYRLPKRYGFITVGASNLFDEKFKYYDTDVRNPRIQPLRYFFVRATFAIP